MQMLYNTVLRCAKGVISAASMVPDSMAGHGKTRKFINGQATALKHAAEFKAGSENYWFHCASLGEYAIARPIMAEIKKRRPQARIALTFFSSTGVETLRQRRNDMADFIGYLPLDTPSNARRLIGLFKPSAALFMVSEYWPNFLFELKRHNIPAFLVSCIFTESAPHFNPIAGSVFRRSLSAYSRIFCLNSNSVDTLRKIGFDRASAEGDPLVDNALGISQTDWTNEHLSKFCSAGRTLVCGSIHNDADLELIAPEINAHPDRRYLLVPHEIDNAHLRRVENALTVPSRRLSDYTPDMTEHVMIVDNIGQLAYLYRLGAMAYIGGGFTRQLHSIVEASVYGLPIAFGPRTERKILARVLTRLGIASTTSTPDEFAAWANHWFSAPEAELDRIRATAKKFCQEQAGATSRIVTTVLESAKRWND